VGDSPADASVIGDGAQGKGSSESGIGYESAV
jgi:hypothetical protein